MKKKICKWCGQSLRTQIVMNDTKEVLIYENMRNERKHNYS